MMQPRDRRQPAAFTVAFLCFVAAIGLRLAKIEGWFVLHWICLSAGFVAFMAGAAIGRQRQQPYEQNDRSENGRREADNGYHDAADTQAELETGRCHAPIIPGMTN